MLNLKYVFFVEKLYSCIYTLQVKVIMFILWYLLCDRSSVLILVEMFKMAMMIKLNSLTDLSDVKSSSDDHLKWLYSTDLLNQ